MKRLILNINKQNTDFNHKQQAQNLANAIKVLSNDIFTEYIRFLFELIQNADDANATKVLINLQENYITIAHNGKKFDERDVIAICSVGDGTKEKDISKTGYKGIGFKSVFGKSNNVGIFSKGVQFRFCSNYKHEKFVMRYLQPLIVYYLKRPVILMFVK